MATISACVITLNEEARLGACLESLAFCDEIVVVDSGSHDRTREIARAAGARVIENPWPGFAAQRNLALDAAGGDWIVEIDADERVTPELAAEVRGLVERAAPEVRMAALPLRQLFLGRPLGPSGRYPGYRHRLFRAGAFRHDESRSVHEGLWPDGRTPALEHDLLHLFASSWGEALHDAIAYARLDASQRSRPTVAEAIAGLAVRPPAKFAYRYLLYGGWRDGAAGFAKIALECGADALVTVLRLLPGSGGEGEAASLGQQALRRGPVRVVGVCLRRRQLAAVNAWLTTAAELGADVALIGPGAAPHGAVPWRRLDRRGPGGLARALDAEDQARPIDALLPAGALERRLLRTVPRALRGAVGPLALSAAPDAAVSDLQRETRDGFVT